ncbi:MAG: carboxypeptidase regulatory-like domain-containing protein [Chloroflexi bacterium]|nr:carboxypeptidase regulatory-like domain-containing protein [Chloroflexota bacterium]
MLPDIEVPVPFFLRMLALETLVLAALLVPLMFFAPSALTVPAAGQENAVSPTAVVQATSTPEPATVTASAVSASSPGPGTATGGLGGQTATVSPAQAAATATAASVVDERVGPGVVAGAVYDARDGQPLREVRIAVEAVNRLAISNAAGRYSLQGIPAGRHELTVTYPGYIVHRETIDVPETGMSGVGFALSPILREGQYRIVLTWGASPRDLDAHLWFPQGRESHVYHPSNNRSALDGTARLDIDARSGQGPETITIDQVYPGTYLFAVNQYSSDGSLATSGSRVTVYRGDQLLQIITAPQGEGRWWSVVTLDGATGTLNVVNTLGNAAPAP